MQTRDIRYCLGVLDNELLLHLYCGKYSSDGLPLEYSSFGSADLRLPIFGAVYSDGSRITKLLYKDYSIKKGKPQIKGLPSTYCEENDNIETLTANSKQRQKISF